MYSKVFWLIGLRHLDRNINSENVDCLLSFKFDFWNLIEKINHSDRNIIWKAEYLVLLDVFLQAYEIPRAADL